MICKFNHDGDCCNSGAVQYMCKRKQPCDTIIPMTNADRIRAMSDKELCDAFFQLIYANYPANWFCKGKKACGDLVDADKDIPDAMCKTCLLEKLRQPAEETPRIVWPHDEPVCQKMDEKIRRLDDKLRGDSCV